jgi:hypothetical protein
MTSRQKTGIHNSENPKAIALCPNRVEPEPTTTRNLHPTRTGPPKPDRRNRTLAQIRPATIHAVTGESDTPSRLATLVIDTAADPQSARGLGIMQQPAYPLQYVEFVRRCAEPRLPIAIC